MYHKLVAGQGQVAVHVVVVGADLSAPSVLAQKDVLSNSWNTILGISGMLVILAKMSENSSAYK